MLAVFLGGCFVCGCLLSNPPDYDEPLDYRPAIDLRDPSDIVLKINVDELSTQTYFELRVWDGNVDQVLRHRWFLNYDPDVEPRCNLASEYLNLATGQEVREVVYPLPHKILTPGNCHRLSAVVTDGEWLDGPRHGCSETVEGANRVLADWLILAHDNSMAAEEVLADECLPLATYDP